MYSLLVANIPYDCNENDVRAWIEANDVSVLSIKLIPDVVSGTSPSFAQVQLRNIAETDAAARRLDGQRLSNRTVRVKALNILDTSKPIRPLQASA